MILDDISIRRSLIATAGKFALHIEAGGFQFTGYFSDMGGFLTAVKEAATFFAVRTGRMKHKDAKLTRPLEPMGPN